VEVNGGCNYFKWSSENVIGVRGNSEKCEGRDDSLVMTEESDGVGK